MMTAEKRAFSAVALPVAALGAALLAHGALTGAPAGPRDGLRGIALMAMPAALIALGIRRMSHTPETRRFRLVMCGALGLIAAVAAVWVVDTLMAALGA